VTDHEIELCRRYGIFARSAHGLLALYTLRVRRMREQLGAGQPSASGRPDVPRVPRSWAAVGV